MSSKHFRMAKEVAIKGSNVHRHRIGALGVRSDGAIVKSPNLPNRLPEPQAHAESRVCKKMDWGGVIYVVRVLRNGKTAIAKPCASCMAAMRNSGVRRCFYSINDNSYGIIEL